jgi:NADH-ubiquinone oxidoreductase chain 1
MTIFYNILEILIILVPVLMAVAFVTIAERKVMASMQRRCGPNAVGVWGLLQPFADALKLLVKEIVIPRQSNSILFVLGPFIVLVLALVGWAIIPFGEGLAILDYDLGVFYALAVSSIASYGILISGWAANSKYPFIGAIRSTAQLLSYELVFSSVILILIIFSGSFSLTYIVETQQAVWNIFPLLPIALMFFIAILAETNRPPFDLPESESELVAGFMTEHGSSIFVFFFLGEYSSLILMSTFFSIFFLGGHHSPDLLNILYQPLTYVYYYVYTSIYNTLYIIHKVIMDFLFPNEDQIDISIKVFNHENQDGYPQKDLDFNDEFDNFDYTSIELGYESEENWNDYMNDKEDCMDIDPDYLEAEIYSEFIDNLFKKIMNVIDRVKYENKIDLYDININETNITQFTDKDTLLNSISILIDKIQGSYILGLKIIIVVFFFIWVRASFPRLRYDQLMSLCWKELLPLVFAYIIFTLCLFYTLDMLPFGTSF